MQTRIKTISTEQLHTLISKITCTWHRAILTILANTGLRVAELTNLRQDDLYISGSPTAELEVRAEIAKNKTPRSIPLNITAQEAVLDLRAAQWLLPRGLGSAWAFPADTPDKHLTPRTIQRICKYYGRKYLNIRLTPHMLRHTFATRLMRKTNSRVVQQLLGHKSLHSTQIYTHPTSQDLTEAIATLD